jgi:D-glycerate 3-kinase
MIPNTLSSKLTEIIDDLISASTSIPIIGLSGPQGSGKSTALDNVLKQSSFRIAGISLDDFYLPKSERMTLSENVNPLFETRGPPGTHDLILLETTLDDLLDAAPATEHLIPKFDKPSDDRLPPEKWDRFQGRPDAIVLEGWMIGATLPPDFLTSSPMNGIENQDMNNSWRREQYEKLSSPYADLWDHVDHFIHIVGPGFDAVQKWRLEQEATNLNVDLSELPDARRQWVFSFIQYFERLTNSMQAGYKRPGIILNIDAEREYIGMV